MRLKIYPTPNRISDKDFSRTCRLKRSAAFHPVRLPSSLKIIRLKEPQSLFGLSSRYPPSVLRRKSFIRRLIFNISSAGRPGPRPFPWERLVSAQSCSPLRSFTTSPLRSLFTCYRARLQEKHAPRSISVAVQRRASDSPCHKFDGQEEEEEAGRADEPRRRKERETSCFGVPFSLRLHLLLQLLLLSSSTSVSRALARCSSSSS